MMMMMMMMILIYIFFPLTSTNLTLCIEAAQLYSSINGIPACANEELLTEILRREWGFNGYVISDGGAVENIIHFHHYIDNDVDTVAACVNAGCNTELLGNFKTPVYLSLGAPFCM
jgi:hypothetical protein